MIRLRFVTSSDAISQMIRLGEYGFWATHVEAVVADGLLGAHMEGGVRLRPWGYDAGTRTRELILLLTVTDEQAASFERFLRSQVGKPYDMGGILGLVAGRNWQDPEHWYCSELMAAGLVECGYFASPLASDCAKITPRDLLLIISGRQAIE